MTVSKKEHCLCGVPQGSVLGALLLGLYINDIYNYSDKVSFYLFAHDTNLLYADKNLRSLETVVNEELNRQLAYGKQVISFCYIQTLSKAYRLRSEHQNL